MKGKQLEICRRRCEDIIKITLTNMKWCNMDWIRLVDDRNRLWCYVFAQINFRVPNCKKFLENYGLYVVLETTLMKLVKRLNDT